jgi:hypothetical protein
VTPLEAAQHVLESLRELVADPQIDFGPAYEGAKNRQMEAIAIMEKIVRNLRSKK